MDERHVVEYADYRAWFKTLSPETQRELHDDREQMFRQTEG